MFQPHLSHGSMDDQIVIPNIPLLSMYAELPSKSFFERLIGGQLIQSSGAAPFVTVAAHNAIWGYDDRLIESIKQYKTLPFERFGLLVKVGNALHTRTNVLYVKYGFAKISLFAESTRE